MSRLPSPIYLQGELIGAGSKGPESKNISRRKLIAFGWYGGKYNHLGWLLPLLPESHHYCEPFAGSAAVLLNRRPSPVETYNDIDGEIANFFKVLRDRTEDLVKHIAFTPFSREEFYWAVSEGTEHLDDLERAREGSSYEPANPEPGWLRPPPWAAGPTARTRAERGCPG